MSEAMEVLPDPLRMQAEHKGQTDMLVQEVIHGHRFNTDQEPFLILLEALAVLAAVPLASHLPKGQDHEEIPYRLPHRRKMRFLLFADRHLEEVLRDSSLADHEKWDAWKKRANGQYDPGSEGKDHFSYLDQTFQLNLGALDQAVRVLRSQELDVMHNRRWTSRFLAVSGPDMVCTDMRASAGGHWSADRRFFARGGELVYLMLSRSLHAKKVGKLVAERLLDPDNPMNKLAQSISDMQSDGETGTRIGYLPYRYLERYDCLAEDWMSILGLHRLPGSHMFDPLFRVTGLCIAAYLAEQASSQTRTGLPEPIVADLMDGSDRQLRESSKAHLNRHRDAANRAVDAFIKGRAARNERWQAAMAQDDRPTAAEVIQDLFEFGSTDRQLKPETQLRKLIDHARSRDKNNAHKFLLPLLKGIGLATARPGTGTWFGVADEMLIALVLANVETTLELRTFVERLYKRYRIVIGPTEARKAFPRLPVGASRFGANLAALETRMTRLGLTHRLSDDCAFVTNPYRQDNE